MISEIPWFWPHSWKRNMLSLIMGVNGMFLIAGEGYAGSCGMFSLHLQENASEHRLSLDSCPYTALLPSWSKSCVMEPAVKYSPSKPVLWFVWGFWQKCFTRFASPHELVQLNHLTIRNGKLLVETEGTALATDMETTKKQKDVPRGFFWRRSALSLASKGTVSCSLGIMLTIFTVISAHETYT